jgi:hypothetical protein
MKKFNYKQILIILLVIIFFASLFFSSRSNKIIEGNTNCTPCEESASSTAEAKIISRKCAVKREKGCKSDIMNDVVIETTNKANNLNAI